MVKGNPKQPLSPLEFSLSALHHVSGLVIATVLAARENKGIVKNLPITKKDVLYNKDDTLTKILEEDGRIEQGYTPLLVRTNDISLIDPEIIINQQSKDVSFYHLAIYNTTVKSADEQFVDLACNIYDSFESNFIRYSMRISPVWFQYETETIVEKKNVVQKDTAVHCLPTNLLFGIDLKPANYFGRSGVLIRKGVPINLSGATQFGLKNIPEAAVFRALKGSTSIVAYSSRTTASYQGREYRLYY